MNHQIPAIVLGCHKVGLGIIRALGAAGVPVIGTYYRQTDIGYLSKYVRERYPCPDPDQDAEGFIDFLKYLGEKKPGSVLIPSDDATLIPVSKNKKMLSNYFKISAPDWSITQKYVEKEYTYAIAEKAGVPAPKTLVSRDIDEIKEFVDRIDFPCLLKPSVGHRFYDLFKQKMIFINNWKEFDDAYRKIGEMKDTMMIQEFIPGNDKSGANYNSFFIKGEPRAEVTAQKVRLTPRQIGFPCVVLSVRVPEIISSGRKMISALDYNGYSCMEFKKDSRDGVYKLMEVNGRLNLSLPLCVMAGINFAYYVYLYSLYGDIETVPARFRENIYWIDIEKDFMEGVLNYRRERLSIKDFFTPYFRPHVYSIPSARDLKPFLKRCWDVAVGGTAILLNRENLTKRSSSQSQKA
jgi:D-aspartate ligase